MNNRLLKSNDPFIKSYRSMGIDEYISPGFFISFSALLTCSTALPIVLAIAYVGNKTNQAIESFSFEPLFECVISLQADLKKIEDTINTIQSAV